MNTSAPIELYAYVGPMIFIALGFGVHLLLRNWIGEDAAIGTGFVVGSIAFGVCGHLMCKMWADPEDTSEVSE